MNTHEEYVTYAQAKALKELGFDWPCKAWWESEYGEWIFYDGYNLSSPASYNTQFNHWMFSAPTQAVACRWLREEKEIEVYAVRHEVYGAQVGFLYKVNFHSDNLAMSKGFPTYESALSAGIDRALQLLKTNGCI